MGPSALSLRAPGEYLGKVACCVFCANCTDCMIRSFLGSRMYVWTLYLAPGPTAPFAQGNSSTQRSGARGCAQIILTSALPFGCARYRPWVAHSGPHFNIEPTNRPWVAHRGPHGPHEPKKKAWRTKGNLCLLHKICATKHPPGCITCGILWPGPFFPASASSSSSYDFIS